MLRVPGANRLLVSATGAFHDDGGFELLALPEVSAAPAWAAIALRVLLEATARGSGRRDA